MTIALLLLYFRRRGPIQNDSLIRRRTAIGPRHNVGKVTPFVQPTGYAPAGGSPSSQGTMPFVPSTAFNPENIYGPSSTLLAQFAHTQSGPSNHNVPVSYPSTPSITAPDPSDRISAFSSAEDAPEARPLSPTTTHQLTRDQLEYLHNLHSLNVPAAEIAVIMWRMRSEREVAASGGRMNSV